MGPVTGTEAGTRPPAWHPDPAGRHRLRWWDGHAWTDRVSDGQTVGRDDPHQVAPPEATPAAGEAPRAPGGEAAGSALDPARRPAPEERPSTGAGMRQDATGGGRRGLVLALAGAAVVIASVLWGLHHHRTAAEWRDRADEVDEALVAARSNNDALEQSLSEAASANAGLQDGQRFVAELSEATDLTVEQLYACARALDALIIAQSPSTIDRANDVCGDAVANGEQLRAILDEVAG